MAGLMKKRQADRCGARSDVPWTTDGAAIIGDNSALRYARWPPATSIKCTASPGELAAFSLAGNSAWHELAGVSAQTSHRRRTDAHP